MVMMMTWSKERDLYKYSIIIDRNTNYELANNEKKRIHGYFFLDCNENVANLEQKKNDQKNRYRHALQSN
mgnify:CR=1 FL=1